MQQGNKLNSINSWSFILIPKRTVLSHYAWQIEEEYINKYLYISDSIPGSASTSIGSARNDGDLVEGNDFLSFTGSFLPFELILRI